MVNPSTVRINRSKKHQPTRISVQLPLRDNHELGHAGRLHLGEPVFVTMTNEEHRREDIRKTVAQAFMKSLRVDSPTQVTPTYRIIGARPDSLACEPILGDDETSVRATTSLVGAAGFDERSHRRQILRREVK